MLEPPRSFKRLKCRASAHKGGGVCLERVLSSPCRPQAADRRVAGARAPGRLLRIRGREGRGARSRPGRSAPPRSEAGRLGRNSGTGNVEPRARAGDGWKRQSERPGGGRTERPLPVRASGDPTGVSRGGLRAGYDAAGRGGQGPDHLGAGRRQHGRYRAPSGRRAAPGRGAGGVSDHQQPVLAAGGRAGRVPHGRAQRFAGGVAIPGASRSPECRPAGARRPPADSRVDERVERAGGTRKRGRVPDRRAATGGARVGYGRRTPGARRRTRCIEGRGGTAVRRAAGNLRGFTRGHRPGWPGPMGWDKSDYSVARPRSPNPGERGHPAGWLRGAAPGVAARNGPGRRDAAGCRSSPGAAGVLGWYTGPAEEGAGTGASGPGRRDRDSFLPPGRAQPRHAVDGGGGGASA
jgi:hypothetical protein